MPNPHKTTLFRPPPPTPLDRLLTSPILFLAKWLYAHRPPLLPPVPASPPIRIVCISDTHNQIPDLPAGDILIHAGDMCVNGTAGELAARIAWLNSLEYKHVIVVAGNHDVCLGRDAEPNPKSNQSKWDGNWGSITYLQNTSTTIHIHART